MASGPQKGIIPEEDLPSLKLFKDGSFGYRVRYRIVSEDGNRWSYYSPTYTVKPNYIFKRPEDIDIDEIDVIRRRRYVNIFWGTVAIRDRVSNTFIRNVDQYDVWLKWSKGNDQGVWILAERNEQDGPRLGFPVPSSYQKIASGQIEVVQEEPEILSIEVYVRARPASREYSSLLVYKLDDEDIELPLPDPAT
jgi:hypothetical protein